MHPHLPSRLLPVSLWILSLFITQFVTAQAPKRPELIGIASVEVQVTDLKKAATFYRDMLGYSTTTTPAGSGKAAALWIKVNHRQTIIVRDGLPTGQIERFIAVGVQTTDAEAMRAYLKSKGIDVPDSLNKKEKGKLSFTIQDPDQHAITFVQYLPIAGQPATVQYAAGKALSDRILHAGLTIRDAAAADRFYKDVLGFSEIWRGGANDSVTSWINMRLPESTDYLEYMLTTTTPTKQQLGSSHHIALLVPDMQKAVDALRIRTAKYNYPAAAPRIGRNKRWQLNLYDPDGTRIELMEPFPMRGD